MPHGKWVWMMQAPPKTIGRYEVLESLGSGAMGAVYLCLDPLLKRKVAVKIVLNIHTDSEVMLRRFQQESEVSAQLNHPNVISVHDVGTDELLGPFITMEYVEGLSMATLLQEASPVDTKVALDWICQVGQALVAAESAGIVHRDVKPENILVGRNGRLKLTDFGLARNEDCNLTTTGIVMGTPPYTAPELLAGTRASSVTDRWAFAVTVFQILTGNRLPHQGDSLASLLHHIANEPPLIPEEMPAPLKRVFLKALHRDPARRYDSILRFLEALAEALGMRGQLDARGLSQERPVDEPPARSLPEAGKRAEGSTPLPNPTPGSGERAAPVARGAKLTAPPSELFRGGQDAQDAPAEVRVGALRSAPNPALSRTPRPTVLHASAAGNESPYRNLLIAAGLALALVGGFFAFPRSIRIESVPPGAKIMMDDRLIGTTPLERRFSFGKHLVQVQLEGYEMEVRSLDARDGDQSFQLKPSMVWTDILTEPAGAEVLLGTRHLGKTPLREILVPMKTEKIVITLDGHRTWEGLLGPTDRLPASIKLERNP